jgi:hypothetical protein
MSDADDRVTRALAQLGTEHEPPVGWESRVLAAIAPAPAPAPAPARRRWWFAVPAAAAVAIAAVLLVPRLLPRPDALALVIEREPSATRLRGDPGDEARIAVPLGGRIRVVARGGGRHHAIWVYRDATALVAHCPGDAACRLADGELDLALALPTIGTYQVVAWSSDTELPAPRGAYDADFAAATTGNATAKLRLVEVQ